MSREQGPNHASTSSKIGHLLNSLLCRLFPESLRFQFPNIVRGRYSRVTPDLGTLRSIRIVSATTAIISDVSRWIRCMHGVRRGPVNGAGNSRVAGHRCHVKRFPDKFNRVSRHQVQRFPARFSEGILPLNKLSGEVSKLNLKGKLRCHETMQSLIICQIFNGGGE